MTTATIEANAQDMLRAALKAALANNDIKWQRRIDEKDGELAALKEQIAALHSPMTLDKHVEIIRHADEMEADIAAHVERHGKVHHDAPHYVDGRLSSPVEDEYECEDCELIVDLEVEHIPNGVECGRFKAWLDGVQLVLVPPPENRPLGSPYQSKSTAFRVLYTFEA